MSMSTATAPFVKDPSVPRNKVIYQCTQTGEQLHDFEFKGELDIWTYFNVSNVVQVMSKTFEIHIHPDTLAAFELERENEIIALVVTFIHERNGDLEEQVNVEYWPADIWFAAKKRFEQLVATGSDTSFAETAAATYEKYILPISFTVQRKSDGYELDIHLEREKPVQFANPDNLCSFLQKLKIKKAYQLPKEVGLLKLITTINIPRAHINGFRSLLRTL